MIALVSKHPETMRTRVKMVDEEELMQMEKEGKVKRVNKKLYVTTDPAAMKQMDLTLDTDADTDDKVVEKVATYDRKDMVAEKEPRKTARKPRGQAAKRKKP